VTGTYTPGASGRFVLIGLVHTGTATVADATSVAGASLTSVSKITTKLVAANNCKIELWKATSTGTAGTVTATFPATNTGAHLEVFEFTNVNTAVGTGGIVQTVSVTGSASTYTLTMGAFSDSRNATFVIWGMAGSGGPYTPTAGWTDLRDSGYATPTTGFEAQFIQTNDTTPTCTDTGTNSFVGIGVEIASS
jgi:hypothetical protein